MREIRLAQKAAKFLKSLPEDYRNALKQRIWLLANELVPRGSIRLQGRGNCFRMRVGPFRIQYFFMEEENVVLVYKISRRNETTYR
ncbi:MAG: type II toxin-antitoxin system RelE/ParE family toxin [Candidatus Micrarchaeia archaeon]